MQSRIISLDNHYHYQLAKISSIHKLILEIKHILDSRKLKPHAHFPPHLSKSMQKISLLNQFILEIQPIYSLLT